MVVMADIVCPVVRADVTCYWKDMWRRLDAMRRLWQLCDVRLRTDDGSSFMAHSPVLAASSDVLHHMLVAARHETFVDGPGIVPVHSVTPDVLRITLDFIYGVTPTSRADFECLRVGAARLGIEGAYEYCCRRLGDSASRFLHTAVQPSGPAAETTAAVDSSYTAVSSELACTAEEASAGDRNSANPTTDLDAGTTEVAESGDLVDAMVVPNDVSHATMMAHMSLEDLARSDECPHLRRLAGEILPPPILTDDCLEDETTGTLDEGFLDSVPLKKRTRNDQPSAGEGSIVREEVNGLYTTNTCGSKDTLLADTSNHSLPSSACDLSLNSKTAPSISFGVEAPDQCPPTFFASGINGDSRCSSVSQTATVSETVAASMELRNPLYATADFSTVSIMKTDVGIPTAQDCCIQYINDCYPMTSLSSDCTWSADQQVTTTGSLLPPVSTCMPPFAADTFASILSTANIVGPDDATCDPVNSGTADVINRSASVLNGCPQDVSFTDFDASPPNPWHNGDTVSLPHASAGVIPQIDLMSANNGMAYFGPSLVASTVQQFSSPVPAINVLSSSSSSSVAAAGGIAADLSYISLDDVSAVLTANGFADKTSSPSEVSPLNHATQSETRTGDCHTSDVNKAGAQMSVNESTPSVTRVCIFCQKPCKSER